VGDKLTQSAHSAELLRAKDRAEALRGGAAARMLTSGEPIISEVPNAWDETSPEIRRACVDQLLECAPEAMTILDADCRVVRVNSEFTRMFGYAAAEAVGQDIEGLVVPEEYKAESQWISESVRQGQRVHLETQRRRKGGELVDVAIASAPVIVSGKHIGLYVVYRDIREQKRAQALSSALYRIAERTNSADNLEEFFGSVHAIVAELMYARNFYIALYDEQAKLVSFRYFVDEEEGAPPPKRLGRGLTEYVLRSSEPLLATPEVFQRLVEQGEVELIGAPSVDWLGVPLRAGNETFGVLAVQSYSQQKRFGERDKEILTFVSQQLASAIEHKKNEEALRRSEARYRSLVQSAVYGIYRSSAEGKFLDVNPALIAMLGYETGEPVLALDPTRDVFVNPQELARLMEDLRHKGRLDSLEVHWKRKDGKTITVRLSGRSVASDTGEEPVLEIIAEDVTERRALEEQFRQAQKMEAVGRLAGGVAHDFNNLLMVISGYTEVLLEQVRNEDPMLSKVQAIQQAADRATTLTRQLLAFSRKQLLELKVVDVNAIVADMERLLRPLIGENIELSTRLMPGIGHTRADAGQLEQVIMNLVVNAKDAMPKGGRIVIQTGQAKLEERNNREHGLIVPGAYVLLTVSDNGMGMDRETQFRIFEPFFTTKEKGKGTGLGLSTVYGIVKQSGGYIFAESAIGRGTTFRIYLPQVESPAEAAVASSATPIPGGGSETVLLVEDEESVRHLVRDTLVSRGYQVIEAENGDAGLRVAREYAGAIDLVITDVVMPGMNGRELVERLAGARPHIKVLYLSGYTEEAILHEGETGPGIVFLQKPFTLHVLSRKVREVLRGEHA